MLLNGNWTPNGIVLRECQHYDGKNTRQFHQYTHVDGHKIFVEVMVNESDSTKTSTRSILDWLT